jgi:hypothetical protein
MRQLQTLYSASGPAALFFYFFLFIPVNKPGDLFAFHYPAIHRA